MKNKYCLFLFCFFFGCISSNKDKSDESVRVELYVAPKVYYCSFVINNGIFNYELNRRNIVMSAKECCFGYYTDKGYDSIITMSYSNFRLTKSQIDSLMYFDVGTTDSLFYSPARILLLIHQETKRPDSAFIDSKFNIKYQNKIYKSSKLLEKLIMESLPLELKENWMDLQLPKDRTIILDE